MEKPLFPFWVEDRGLSFFLAFLDRSGPNQGHSDLPESSFGERGLQKTASARCTMKWARVFAFVILVPTLAAPLPQEGSDRSSENGTARPGWRALQQSMETMHAAMMAEGPSGNDDVDFVKLMIPHHQAAIDMAKAQLLYGKDPQMRRLAQEIITDQQSEIELMQLWLKQHQPR